MTLFSKSRTSSRGCASPSGSPISLAHAELPHGQFGAADLDGGGEDLRDVGAAGAEGEAGGAGVGPFEGGVADDGHGVALLRGEGDGRSAVAAGDAQVAVGQQGLDAHDFGAGAEAELVVDAEAVGVLDAEGFGVGEGGDGVGVGQRGVLEPLVDDAAGRRGPGSPRASSSGVSVPAAMATRSATSSAISGRFAPAL